MTRVSGGCLAASLLLLVACGDDGGGTPRDAAEDADTSVSMDAAADTLPDGSADDSAPPDAPLDASSDTSAMDGSPDGAPMDGGPLDGAPTDSADSAEACAPASCTDLGYTCGNHGDGCGGTLSCGSCTTPDTCGGGGVMGACGCTPDTCTSLGATCGTPDDGCGGTLDCGGCTAPDTCGGGSSPLSCGCTPDTCTSLGLECGDGGPDGCGGMLTCGGCTAPETCGGGGTANMCGCTPTTTCASLGVTCGVYPDDCGLPLDCGPCACTRETVSTGFVGPGLGSTTTTRNAWSNPRRIQAGATGSATVNLSASSTVSGRLMGTDFGFALPPDAEILGIEATISRGCSCGRIEDSSVRLSQRGSYSGENKAHWQTWYYGGSSRTYGAADDLWGRTWTPVDINRPDFGVGLSARYIELSGNQTASVAAMTVNVHYTQCVP